MAQPAIKPHQVSAAPRGTAAVAAGGPIADLQRTIEERMMVTDWQSAAQASAAPAESGRVHLVSRIAGPTLLVAAYAGVALWWL